MDLDFALRNSYGVVRTQLLLRCGLTKAAIRQSVAAGALFPVRHGWYATSSAHRDVLAAVRAGGVLSCVSALALHGIWTPSPRHIHLRRTDHARYRGAREPTGKGFVRCGHLIENRRPATAVDPVSAALSSAARCVNDEELVAILDSVLRSRRVDLHGVRAVMARHPARVRRLLDFVDPRAESGTESLVRYRLDQRRIKHRLQVVIEGVGRVDLLIGRRLVIEVDSREYHTGEDAYESDRRRDRRAAGRGYQVIRVTYRQVMFEWNDVLADLLALIRRREHLRHPFGFDRYSSMRSR